MLLDDDRPQQDIDTILTPCIAGARKAIEYLYGLGRRRIGIMGGSVIADGMPEARGCNTRDRRFEGCRQAFDRLGMDWDSACIIPTSWNDTDARQAVHYHETLIRQCDALFCMTDTVAFGTLRGLKDLDISVPDDMAVIGFDGIAMGAMTVPSLTTIAVDVDFIAKQAVDLLIKRINYEPDLPHQRIVAGYHIEHRESA